MTIAKFEQGKFYKFVPGTTQVVHIKKETVKESLTIGQKLVGETQPTGKLWFVTGNEDLTKYTEITEQEFIDFVNN